MPTAYAHIPPGAIRSGFAGRKPSGIPAARSCDRGALVSSSFPSRGPPLFRRVRGETAETLSEMGARSREGERHT